MSKLKNVVVVASMLSGAATQATFVDSKSTDRLFNTLNPKASISGIVLDVKASDYSTYADKVLKLALEQSHQVAKGYLKKKEYKKYYTMMLMGLAVPMHEGLFIHFRKVKNTSGRCSQKKNSGGTLKDQGKTKTFYRKGFNMDTSNPFFANCSTLKPNQSIIQMVAGGGDGSDLGIMQVSARWHYEEFLRPELYRAAKTTLGYGNKYIYRGFNQVARNASKYKCILNKNGSINHLKLARGVWGGWYNAGGTDTKRICRFANPKSVHANKDKGFNSNLRSVIEAGTKGGAFGLPMFRPKLSSQSRATIKELYNNLVNNTNTRTQLKRVIGQ